MKPGELDEMRELRERLAGLPEVVRERNDAVRAQRDAEARVRALETQVQELPILRGMVRDFEARILRQQRHIDRLLFEKNAIWAPHLNATAGDGTAGDLTSDAEGPE